MMGIFLFFFFQAEDGIRDIGVTGVQTCALPIALITGLAAAVAGPLVEIAVVQAGAASYAGGSDGLAGVAPWLPCLYFAAGAVAARLWGALASAPRTS